MSCASAIRMSGQLWHLCHCMSPGRGLAARWPGGENGDEIELDVPSRSLKLCVEEKELERRRQAWQAPPPRYQRGWGCCFPQHVNQAHGL